MRRGRHSVEHERRCRGSVSDVGRTQHRNLGPRDWKSESFESWKFFSLRVDSAKHDDCHAYNQKKLAHAHLRSKACDGCPARREISRLCCAGNLLICRSTSKLNSTSYHFRVWSDRFRLSVCSVSDIDVNHHLSGSRQVRYGSKPSLLGAMVSYANRWDDQMLDSLDP